MQELNLAKDKHDRDIQALAPLEATVANVTIGGASASVALPAGARVVEVAASSACRMAFGNSGVTATATSRLFPAGVSVYKVPEDASGVAATHLAVIQYSGSTGDVTVTRLF
jgi:hypothetical protein